MRTTGILSFIVFIIAAAAASSEIVTPSIFKPFQHDVQAVARLSLSKGPLDYFAGYFYGFIQQCYEDALSVKDCVVMVADVTEAGIEYVKYIVNLKSFDIIGIVTKFFDFFVGPVFNWAQECAVPYKYYKRYEILFRAEKITPDILRKFFINGFLYNIVFVLYYSYFAISECMLDNYFACGELFGNVSWILLVR